ncbi:hypothetical protein [Streptomyces alkaliphilus]|uniref:hypothetical protein n=1 Tax=Streptomyces alkaliphilus TaxID=1472722 RepID=UPI001180CD7E|nr:hypothetical protein [Streptomyces alkaliphilus]MQS07147.1 hypothetical protein [Streptomyces alkaliphilus]
MRPERFRDFALEIYGRAPGITAVESWSEGTERPFGIEVTLASGARVRHAITAQAAEGDRYDEPEKPVEKDPPAEIPVPELGTGRGIPLVDIERYLAAVLNNSGSPEIERTYSYRDREQPSMTSGIGLVFHSGARIFAPFVHVMRAGERTPGRPYDLPSEV